MHSLIWFGYVLNLCFTVIFQTQKSQLCIVTALNNMSSVLSQMIKGLKFQMEEKARRSLLFGELFISNLLASSLIYRNHTMRKLVFGVSDQV